MTNRRTFLVALGAVAAAPWVPMPAIRPKPPIPMQIWAEGAWMHRVYQRVMLGQLMPNMLFNQMRDRATVLGQNAALHLDQSVLQIFEEPPAPKPA